MSELTGERLVVRAVEAASLLILTGFVYAQPPERRRAALREAVLIALGAILGEESCMALYGFYSYSPHWTLKLWRLPLMVACIWPAVVLSAREVIAELVPNARHRPLATAALVLFDATLVEAVSVAVGLWRWDEGAVFAVPLIGLVGWAAYAGWSTWWASRPAPWWLRVLGTVAGTHLVLLVGWWGALRWTLRAPLSPVGLAFGSALVSLVLSAWAWRRRGAVPLRIMLPRASAAVLFFALVFVAGASAASGGLALLWFAAPFALPYLLLTRWRRAPAR